jgi:DNA-binding LacI/PurR family transcriptional regulator
MATEPPPSRPAHAARPHPDRVRPTLDQVAAHAGVGRGTVSRVINGSPQVSPEAREAVRKAIADLGYVPNRAARTLVTRRTESVALVVSESEERLFGEPFFAAIVRGVSSALAETGMQLWLAMAQSSAERTLIEPHLTDQHVDGVLLLSLHDDDPLPSILARRGLPTVLGGRPAHMLNGVHSELSFVDNDNAGGARAAVEFLLGRGRRCVAAIAGPQDMAVGVARLRGYRAAMRAIQNGSPVSDRLVAYGDFSEASGAAAMERLLHLTPDLDAVFAASDPMAAGALRVLHAHGRRVPADVAVVGFDDSAVARQTQPPLTTVHQAVEGMGREMVRLLLARIGGGPAHSTVLDTHLVVREST